MFNGRYGFDAYGKALAIFAAAISVPTLFIPYQSPARLILNGLTLVILAYALFRAISRNFAARQSELYKYSVFERKVSAFLARARDSWRGGKNEFDERRKYKHLTCPQCMQKLRVPRGKGKLRVTCTRCGNKFLTKS
jgi:DNA-directed RNA polymerase subunit RPC12/RpoP